MGPLTRGRYCVEQGGHTYATPLVSLRISLNTGSENCAIVAAPIFAAMLSLRGYLQGSFAHRRLVCVLATQSRFLQRRHLDDGPVSRPIVLSISTEPCVRTPIWCRRPLASRATFQQFARSSGCQITALTCIPHSRLVQGLRAFSHAVPPTCSKRCFVAAMDGYYPWVSIKSIPVGNFFKSNLVMEKARQSELQSTETRGELII